MPFVQVADFRSYPKRCKQPPAPDSKEDFLLEAQLRTTAIQLARDAAMYGEVRSIVAVQEVESHPPDVRLPRAQPD